jgi:hypothetical protein
MINEAQEARRSNPDQASFSAVETLEDTQDDHGTEQLSLF